MLAVHEDSEDMAMPSQPDPRPEAETVRYDIVEGVAWVFFNRPD